MAKFNVCDCSIECEEIKLADGSTVIVCVGCETYSEKRHYRGRLFALHEKPIVTARRIKRAAA